jgi:hypothetical protein
MTQEFIIHMEEIDWNEMYPERPLDYEGIYEMTRHYDYLEYDSFENNDYESQYESFPLLEEETVTPPPSPPPMSPPPAPRKRARPEDFDMEMLPPGKRLCF